MLNTSNQMKLLYILALIIGCFMVTILQLVEVAKTRDIIVAGVLSRHPESWTISMDDTLKSRFSSYDVKKEVIAALEKRRSCDQDGYLEILYIGCAAIAFSTIGLMRERKIDKLCKLIAPAAAAPPAPAC
jgi:hypothetical protein